MIAVTIFVVVVAVKRKVCFPISDVDIGMSLKFSVCASTPKSFLTCFKIKSSSSIFCLG